MLPNSSENPAVDLPPDCKPIPGYADYCVSSVGVVYSRFVRGVRPIRRGEWRALKKSLLMNRYFTACVRDSSGKSKTLCVHSLVMLAFVGPCPLGQEVRHLNDIGTDNRWPGNLAYGTRAENCADKVRNGGHLVSEQHPFARLTTEDVREIRRLRSEGRLTYKVIADRFKIGLSTAYGIIMRTKRKHDN